MEIVGAAPVVRLTVYGCPVPQGSSKAFYVKKLGRSVITSANKGLKPWRQMISETAIAETITFFPKGVALRMTLDFYFTRPPSAPKARTRPVVRPDTDKLIRSILDALTGIAYEDDSQVVSFGRVDKWYGSPERVEISIQEAI